MFFAGGMSFVSNFLLHGTLTLLRKPNWYDFPSWEITEAPFTVCYVVYFAAIPYKRTSAHSLVVECRCRRVPRSPSSLAVRLSSPPQPLLFWLQDLAVPENRGLEIFKCSCDSLSAVLSVGARRIPGCVVRYLFVKTVLSCSNVPFITM